MANNIVKFEAGKRYWDTSAVDHEDVMVIEITRRTGKSVWFVRVRNGKPDGEPARTKIYTGATREYIMPYKYSMAPVWEADREMKPEAAEQTAPEADAATPDEPETEAATQEAAMETEADAVTEAADEPEPKAGMKFCELPEAVQNDVKECLCAYDRCSVTYENGAYHVSAGAFIKANYAPDFKVCGRYAATGIFTPEERVLNYANEFYSYPPEYHGKRDYRMMNAAQEGGKKLAYDAAGNICMEDEPQTPDVDTTEAVLKRGREALDRTESLCYDGKLDHAFAGCMNKAYYRALTEYRYAAARANNPRLAAALDKAKAKQESPTQETPATEAPAQAETRLDIAAFCAKYVEEYGFCKDNGDNVAGFAEAVEAFGAFCGNEANAALVREFCAHMGDYITSDREAAAFMFALESMTAPPMCETETETEGKVVTLLDVHAANARAIEDEEIFSVKVLWNDGDSFVEYADVAEAMNEFGADKAVSAWELDGTALNVWLAQPAQETPDSGEPDALEVVRILGETLNLVSDNGGEVEAMKAQVALWETVDEFKRRGVALKVEYDANGRFVNVREAGQPAPADDAAITDAAAKFIFLVEKHNSMMENAHYASLGGDSAAEMDYLKSGDRLYKAINNSAERLRRAGMEVRLTDGGLNYYRITSVMIKRDGAIIAAYPEEAAAGKFVVTGQHRRDLARCETREEAEAVKTRIGGFDVIPVEDYTEPETDCDCAAWNFSREQIEELAAVVAEDVNDPDPEREWDFDSIGALLAVAGFYGDKELARMDACKTAEEHHALLMSELREAERICNVKIFKAT